MKKFILLGAIFASFTCGVAAQRNAPAPPSTPPILFGTLPTATPKDQNFFVGDRFNKTAKIPYAALRDSVSVRFYPHVVSGIMETNNAEDLRRKFVNCSDGKLRYIDFSGTAFLVGGGGVSADALTNGLAGKADVSALTNGLAGKADVSALNAKQNVLDLKSEIIVKSIISRGGSNSGINQYTNIAYGENCLTNVTGDSNTGIGSNSSNKITSGSANTGLGTGSLFNTTTGNFNVGIGFGALGSNITGSNNIGIGNQVLLGITSLSNQLSIGGWVTGDNGKIAFPQMPTYANDAAADADTTLPRKGFYRLTTGRAVYQKP